DFCLTPPLRCFLHLGLAPGKGGGGVALGNANVVGLSARNDMKSLIPFLSRRVSGRLRDLQWNRTCACVSVTLPQCLHNPWSRSSARLKRSLYSPIGAWLRILLAMQAVWVFEAPTCASHGNPLHILLDPLPPGSTAT